VRAAPYRVVSEARQYWMSRLVRTRERPLVCAQAEHRVLCTAWPALVLTEQYGLFNCRFRSRNFLRIPSARPRLFTNMFTMCSFSLSTIGRIILVETIRLAIYASASMDGTPPLCQRSCRMC
jgi:hypothetical protein